MKERFLWSKLQGRRLKTLDDKIHQILYKKPLTHTKGVCPVFPREAAFIDLKQRASSAQLPNQSSFFRQTIFLNALISLRMSNNWNTSTLLHRFYTF